MFGLHLIQNLGVCKTEQILPKIALMSQEIWRNHGGLKFHWFLHSIQHSIHRTLHIVIYSPHGMLHSPHTHLHDNLCKNCASPHSSRDLQTLQASLDPPAASSTPMQAPCSLSHELPTTSTHTPCCLPCELHAGPHSTGPPPQLALHHLPSQAPYHHHALNLPMVMWQPPPANRAPYTNSQHRQSMMSLQALSPTNCLHTMWIKIYKFSHTLQIGKQTGILVDKLIEGVMLMCLNRDHKN